MTPVLMPVIGQDLTKGRILEWRKKTGDPVTKGEVIASVESEKAAFDVESPATGTLSQILFEADTEAEVLKPIAYITATGETSVPAPAPKPVAAPKPTPPPTTPTLQHSIPPTSRSASSPSARRVAREQHVSLSGVKGTGPGGRIVKKDVLAATQPTADETIPFNKMRKTIADRLTKAKQTIPHIYLFVDVDLEDALRWREAHNAAGGAKITVSDIILHAVATTLRQYRRLNAHVETDKLIVKKSVNLGVATAVEDGLLVPVLKDADTLSLAELAAAVKRITDNARQGRLDYGVAGTFTVTSLGMFGIPAFLPIINPPECAILAVGAAEPRVVPWQGGIAVRRVMSLTLACDHRGVDGAYAAQFLGALKTKLETTGR
jgi:pyruvate dehydrogenase E2 component (dihydrolipoamide acetyltransferase)